MFLVLVVIAHEFMVFFVCVMFGMEIKRHGTVVDLLITGIVMMTRNLPLSNAACQ